MVKQRVVLYLLIFFLVMINFIQRIDLYIILLAMLGAKERLKIGIPNVDICFTGTSEVFIYSKYVMTWNKVEINMLYSSYFWTYFITQVVGPVAAEKTGPKVILLTSCLMSSVCKLCFPFACKTHLTFAIICRCIEGLVNGLSGPTIKSMAKVWIPDAEREWFATTFTSANIGIGIVYVIYSELAYVISWEHIFHISGAIGIVWCIFWIIYVYDTPADHPYISPSELEYIAKHLTKHEVRKTPWVDITTHPDIWLAILCNYGRFIQNYFVVMYGPAFFSEVFNYKLRVLGTNLGIVYLASFLVTVIVTYVASSSKRISHSYNIRKMAQIICQGVPGFILIFLYFVHCDAFIKMTGWGIIVLMFSTGNLGAVGIDRDIAPNFSGPISAFTQTIVMTSINFVAVIVSFFTYAGGTIKAWNSIGAMVGAFAIITLIPFIMFAKIELAQWNYYVDNLTEIEAITENKAMTAIPESRRKRTSSIDPSMAIAAQKAYEKITSRSRYSTLAFSGKTEENQRASIFQDFEHRQKKGFSRASVHRVVDSNTENKRLLLQRKRSQNRSVTKFS